MSDDRAALEELATRLWDERRSATFLLYKLTVSRLLLAGDEQRFVPEALREVDAAVAPLRNAELRRDEAVRALAERWQVAPDEVSLPALAANAPPPFDHTFTEHLAALGGLAAQIESASRENRVPARAQLCETETGDAGIFSARMMHLTAAAGRIGDARSAIGNATGHPELARRPAADSLPSTRTELSDLEPVDVAQGIMELQIQEIGYQATLHSLGQALPPSLVSFLR